MKYPLLWSMSEVWWWPQYKSTRPRPLLSPHRMQIAASEDPAPGLTPAPLIRTAANDLQTKSWAIFVYDAAKVREGTQSSE